LFNEFLERAKRAFSTFFKNRLLVLGSLMGILVLIVLVRLFSLQVIHGESYSNEYQKTTKKEISIAAMRGNIYDRNGNLLAGNKVVKNIIINDFNYYTKSNGAFNEMIIRLLDLLEKNGQSIVTTLPIALNSSNEFVFSGTTSKIRQLIRDVYGTETIQEYAENGIDAYEFDAETVMSKIMTIYNFTKKWEKGSALSKELQLKICHVRYALATTSYTRYVAVTVAKDVSEEVQAAILESQNDLQGVLVEESYERVYYDAECFSAIMGYVGSITTEEMEELNAQGGDYIAGDMIGKEGVEASYESYLQGKKGKKIIYVNNVGMILYEEIISEPTQGDDVYLSVDRDITIAAYNVTEQQLAGVIVNHLYEGTDYDPLVAYEQANYLLPIRDIYFQMINNNILSMAQFAAEDASSIEKKMEEKRIFRKQTVVEILDTYLSKESTTPLSEMDTYWKNYINYCYSYMTSNAYLLTKAIDTTDEVYKAWKAEEISFPTFLTHAIAMGWVDTSVLGEEDRYSTVSMCYKSFCKMILASTEEDYSDFDKLVYSELIHTDVISGCEIGIALFEQDILKPDEETYQKLLHGDNAYAYDFFEAKITSMELTPAQIALDPCSAGVVLTNPNTGELLAVVSYPGYDLNQINNAEYYLSLLSDMSSPLYSRATQSRLAPGSTYKMITTTAALEGGYLQPDSTIVCEGIFPYLDHPRCWIYRLNNETHGELDLIHALGQSCNCCFYECGYLFSLNSRGVYSPSTGISVLNTYASMYGFGSLTGIEVSENVSILTNELPVTSAIGQGTNAFTTISLARYVTAIASSGDVYEFKLLKEIVDREGLEVVSYSPVVTNHLDFAQSTWDIIHEGMYTVVHTGGSRNGDFVDLRLHYAAKSGSAQENKRRPEHGLYVSYGPYDDISYAMAVQIPNGYSAGNAALISKAVYEYLEGDVTLEEILENSAQAGDINDIGD